MHMQKTENPGICWLETQQTSKHCSNKYGATVNTSDTHKYTKQKKKSSNNVIKTIYKEVQNNIIITM